MAKKQSFEDYACKLGYWLGARFHGLDGLSLAGAILRGQATVAA